MFKSINIIVCCDNKNGIGIDNNLPWNIKSEMKIFRQKTIGNGNNCVIMGKNTYNSIPSKYRPLKDRINYVVSTTMEEEKGIFILENLDNNLINMVKILIMMHIG
uniref:dihydrofolate reductase n=1 Tax=Florenciella sp. virus SA2 TaxID=3240092 RepID=A0AB39J8R0_9VIRU